MTDEIKIDRNDYLSFGVRKFVTWGRKKHSSHVITIPKLCRELFDLEDNEKLELLMAKDKSHLVMMKVNLKTKEN